MTIGLEHEVYDRDKRIEVLEAQAERVLALADKWKDKGTRPIAIGEHYKSGRDMLRICADELRAALKETE